MNWHVVRTLFIHELKMLVRARRTVVMAVVIPVFIMPIMLYATRYTERQRQQTISDTTYQYAVTGPLAERVRELIAQARESINTGSENSSETLRNFKLVEAPAANPRESLERNELHFYLETMTGEAADAVPVEEQPAAAPGAPRTPPAPKRLDGVPLVK